jgi:hypothetical protein
MLLSYRPMCISACFLQSISILILGKPYDIIRPLYIDIDIKSHELFVLTNDGKSVYCFEKQMDDVWRENFQSEIFSL